MNLDQVVNDLLEQVLEEARSRGCARVMRVRFVLGGLAGVSPDDLAACFQERARDPALLGTSIDVRLVPAQARCKDCTLEFEPEADPWPCPRCASFSWVLLEGDELFLDGIDTDSTDGE